MNDFNAYDANVDFVERDWPQHADFAAFHIQTEVIHRLHTWNNTQLCHLNTHKCGLTHLMPRECSTTGSIAPGWWRFRFLAPFSSIREVRPWPLNRSWTWPRRPRTRRRSRTRPARKTRAATNTSWSNSNGDSSPTSAEKVRRFLQGDWPLYDLRYSYPISDGIRFDEQSGPIPVQFEE